MDGRNPASLGTHGKPLLVGIYRRIIRNQGFLSGAQEDFVHPQYGGGGNCIWEFLVPCPCWHPPQSSRGSFCLAPFSELDLKRVYSVPSHLLPGVGAGHPLGTLVGLEPFSFLEPSGAFSWSAHLGLLGLVWARSTSSALLPFFWELFFFGTKIDYRKKYIFQPLYWRT